MRSVGLCLASLFCFACGGGGESEITSDVPRALAVGGDRVVVVASANVLARSQPIPSSEDDVDPNGTDDGGDWAGDCGSDPPSDDVVTRSIGPSVVFVSE